MLQEFKNFLKVQNLLLENSNLSLNESTEIAQKIIDIIKQYNEENENKKDFVPVEIPEKVRTDIEPTENENLLNIELNGKRQNIKIGRLLRQLLPTTSNKNIEALVYKIKKELLLKKEEKYSILKNYDFVIDNDVVKWYRDFDKFGLGSCMTNPDIVRGNIKVLDLYRLDDNIKILLIYEKKDINALVGRALIWYNTLIDKPFIDRLYAVGSFDDIYNIHSIWAEKNNYAYRGKGLYNTEILNSSEKKITYLIPENIAEKLTYLPYMDTFKFYNKEIHILLNYKPPFQKEGIIQLQSPNGTLVCNEEIYDKLANLKKETLFNFLKNDRKFKVVKVSTTEENNEFNATIIQIEGDKTKHVYHTYKVLTSDEVKLEVTNYVNNFFNNNVYYDEFFDLESFINSFSDEKFWYSEQVKFKDYFNVSDLNELEYDLESISKELFDYLAEKLFNKTEEIIKKFYHKYKDKFKKLLLEMYDNEEIFFYDQNNNKVINIEKVFNNIENYKFVFYEGFSYKNVYISIFKKMDVDFLIDLIQEYYDILYKEIADVFADNLVTYYKNLYGYNAFNYIEEQLGISSKINSRDFYNFIKDYINTNELIDNIINGDLSKAYIFATYDGIENYYNGFYIYRTE